MRPVCAPPSCMDCWLEVVTLARTCSVIDAIKAWKSTGGVFAAPTWGDRPGNPVADGPSGNPVADGDVSTPTRFALGLRSRVAETFGRVSDPTSCTSCSTALVERRRLSRTFAGALERGRPLALGIVPMRYT